MTFWTPKKNHFQQIQILIITLINATSRLYFLAKRHSFPLLWHSELIIRWATSLRDTKIKTEPSVNVNILCKWIFHGTWNRIRVVARPDFTIQSGPKGNKNKSKFAGEKFYFPLHSLLICVLFQYVVSGGCSKYSCQRLIYESRGCISSELNIYGNSPMGQDKNSISFSFLRHHLLVS